MDGIEPPIDSQPRGRSLPVCCNNNTSLTGSGYHICIKRCFGRIDYLHDSAVNTFEVYFPIRGETRDDHYHFALRVFMQSFNYLRQASNSATKHKKVEKAGLITYILDFPPISNSTFNRLQTARCFCSGGYCQVSHLASFATSSRWPAQLSINNVYFRHFSRKSKRPAILVEGQGWKFKILIPKEHLWFSTAGDTTEAFR